jgi:hypothetical protein
VIKLGHRTDLKGVEAKKMKTAYYLEEQEPNLFEEDGRSYYRGINYVVDMECVGGFSFKLVLNLERQLENGDILELRDRSLAEIRIGNKTYGASRDSFHVRGIPYNIAEEDISKKRAEGKLCTLVAHYIS